MGIAGLLLTASLAGLAPAATPGAPPWELQQVAVLEGFDTPECVCVDPATGVCYVSNVVAPKLVADKVNVTDGTGFISRLAPGGRIESLRWIESTPAAPLNSLKGLCIRDGVLYGADLTRIVRYELATRKALPPIEVAGAIILNDMFSDGRSVYASDTRAGRIHRFDGRQVTEFASLKGANGLTAAGGRFFALSTTEHDLFELDPRGAAEPRPFGLVEHFAGPDGIEVLADGSFLVSDVRGHKLCHVGADRKTVRVLAELQYPADIGLDRQRNLLFVPLFWDSRVMVYQLPKIASEKSPSGESIASGHRRPGGSLHRHALLPARQPHGRIEGALRRPVSLPDPQGLGEPVGRLPRRQPEPHCRVELPAVAHDPGLRSRGRIGRGPGLRKALPRRRGGCPGHSG